MIKLTKEQVISIHSSLIEATGGTDGVRDIGLLESALETPFQTFDGKELYPSLQEKAANLLYFITKNHSFNDGNKRIAATMFLYFLDKNDWLFENGVKRIADNTLVALTIMIAESKPAEKELMVNLVMNFLK